jgi:2-oxoisovalerate ferredoxin oxidoreductase beta subunit
MASYTVIHEKAAAFYDTYERKGELQNQTHYCPGCGHGIVHKLLAEAIDELGVQDRTVLISPVGCSVFAYYYFDVGNIQVAHGRAPAAATAVKRSRPESIVIGYQGDGDLAAIGTAEIVHAANRGEPITVIFVNNGIYGMTGGQMAPTTPLGKKTTTSPMGRDAMNEGFPLHVCEMLNSLDAPVFIERVALGNNKQIMHAARVIKRALSHHLEDAARGGAALRAGRDGSDLRARQSARPHQRGAGSSGTRGVPGAGGSAAAARPGKPHGRRRPAGASTPGTGPAD